MRQTLFRIAHVLMGVIACAWPLGVYQHIPLTGLTVVAIAGGGLVFLWLTDLVVYRIPRVPFELFWPTVAIDVIATAIRDEHAVEIAGIATTFLAALHFARDRATIERWITWSAAACFIAGIADGLYRLGYGWPTAYAIPAYPSYASRIIDAASATSVSLVNGSATQLTGILLWAAIANRTRTTTHRLLCVIGLNVMTVVFIANIEGLVRDGAIPSEGWMLAPSTEWLLGGMALWLAARIGAKVWVEHERTPEGRYLLVGAPLVAIALVACFTGLHTMLWHGWIAALAAGYVIRDKRTAPDGDGRRFGGYAALALIPIAALNAWFVDESNPHDGRNYIQDVRADYAAGHRLTAVHRLEFWRQRTGESPAQCLWMAHIALDFDRPDAAAAWASHLWPSTSANSLRRPAPTESEINALLNRIRDYVSALPEAERSFAYERALRAVGNTEAGMASLRQRIAGTNPVYTDIERAPLQRAAEFLFRDTSALVDFSDWSVAELIAVLGLTKARIEPAPDEIDRSWLPAAITVRRDADGVAVYAESVVSQQYAFGDAMITLDTSPARLGDRPWQTAALPFDASWQITLHTDDENTPPNVTVTFDQDGNASVLLSDPLPASLPDQSAVFIWLP